MPAVILRAHYDGKHLVLDEPADLPLDRPLAVTVSVLAELAVEEDRAEWMDFAMRNFARGYGDDEPEYTLADIKPPS